MLHDFSHVTPPELGSSYEVMLLEAFFFLYVPVLVATAFTIALGA